MGYSCLITHSYNYTGWNNPTCSCKALRGAWKPLEVPRGPLPRGARATSPNGRIWRYRGVDVNDIRVIPGFWRVRIGFWPTGRGSAETSPPRQKFLNVIFRNICTIPAHRLLIPDKSAL